MPIDSAKNIWVMVNLLQIGPSREACETSLIVDKTTAQLKICFSVQCVEGGNIHLAIDQEYLHRAATMGPDNQRLLDVCGFRRP